MSLWNSAGVNLCSFDVLELLTCPGSNCTMYAPGRILPAVGVPPLIAEAEAQVMNATPRIFETNMAISSWSLCDSRPKFSR